MTIEANPVRPPSATPAALSMKVVFELTPPAPPTIAAMLSTNSTRPTPGTEPSSLASPASEATPVTVPIVSKKSVSMMAKIVSAAATGPSTVHTLVTSNWPSVEKLGVAENSVRDRTRRRGSARRS